MSRSRLVAFVLVASVALAACAPAPPGGEGTAEAPEGADGVRVTVTRVVDGDTVEVEPAVDGEEDVRLIGVDTPESAGSPRGAQPLAEEAEGFARERLEGRRVVLEFDVEREDDYGRALAYVRLNGVLFNEELLREGYAQVATFPPNTRYLGRYEAAQDEARGARRGIWGLPESEACLLTDRGNGIGGGC